LQCLCEVHTEEEFEKILPFTPDIVGVNNRNLKDFTVSLTNTERLVPIIKDKLPNAVVVSESGIASVDDYKRVRGAGADAVLIGETFMRSKNLKDLFGLFVCS
jgi:indole-3-glycerol phosphate synthase